MVYDAKLLRWFARLSRPGRLESALDADAFRREAVRDLKDPFKGRPRHGVYDACVAADEEVPHAGRWRARMMAGR